MLDQQIDPQKPDQQKRGRGRPRTEAPSTPVSFRLPAQLHSRIAERAGSRNMSVSQYLRRVVMFRLS